MGCDIHMVLERRYAGDHRWLGVWASDIGKGRPRAARRDYALFAELGVRGCADHPIYPRNVPKDVSELAWKLYMDAPVDHHSASHCTVPEFVERFLKHNPGDPDVRPAHAAYDLFGLDSDFEGAHRLVFWFDN